MYGAASVPRSSSRTVLLCRSLCHGHEGVPLRWPGVTSHPWMIAPRMMSPSPEPRFFRVKGGVGIRMGYLGGGQDALAVPDQSPRSQGTQRCPGGLSDFDDHVSVRPRPVSLWQRGLSTSTLWRKAKRVPLPMRVSFPSLWVPLWGMLQVVCSFFLGPPPRSVDMVHLRCLLLHDSICVAYVMKQIVYPSLVLLSCTQLVSFFSHVKPRLG